MVDQAQATGSSEGPLNSTLARLDSTLEQQTATTVTGLHLPTFSGKPFEDVTDFINRFKLSTFALSDKHRCLALNKCLAGTANIWAKTNIKKAILEGQWKPIKKALLERFGPTDFTLKHREKLSSMKYESGGDTTLIGYVEKYLNQYQKAYKSHTDADAIISLRLNLPTSIIRNLNLLDDTWASFTDSSELYKLIRRYEDNIMPYEKDQDASGTLGKEGVKELLNQLRNEFGSQINQTREMFGAIQEQVSKNVQSQPNNANLDRYRYVSNNGFRPFNQRRFWPKRDQNIDTRQIANKQPRLAIDNKPSASENNANSHYTGHPMSMINQDRGKPPSACYYCQGDHWNSECPSRQVNLNFKGHRDQQASNARTT